MKDSFLIAIAILYIAAAVAYSYYLYNNYKKLGDKFTATTELYWIPIITYFSVGSIYLYTVYVVNRT